MCFICTCVCILKYQLSSTFIMHFQISWPCSTCSWLHKSRICAVLKMVKFIFLKLLPIKLDCKFPSSFSKEGTMIGNSLSFLSLSLLCSYSSEQLRPGVGFLFTRCRFSCRASPRSSTSLPATSLASFAISFPEGSASIHHPDRASLFSVCTHHARHWRMDPRKEGSYRSKEGADSRAK